MIELDRPRSYGLNQPGSQVSLEQKIFAARPGT